MNCENVQDNYCLLSHNYSRHLNVFCSKRLVAPSAEASSPTEPSSWTMWEGKTLARQWKCNFLVQPVENLFLWKGFWETTCEATWTNIKWGKLSFCQQCAVLVYCPIMCFFSVLHVTWLAQRLLFWQRTWDTATPQKDPLLARLVLVWMQCYFISLQFCEYRGKTKADMRSHARVHFSEVIKISE